MPFLDSDPPRLSDEGVLKGQAEPAEGGKHSDLFLFTE